MVKRSEQPFSQKIYTNGQVVHEKMLNIANHQRNASQNHKISPHTCQNDCHQKEHKCWWGYVLKFIFNWRITALQRCVGFCHTAMWLSHEYTCIPSLKHSYCWKLPMSHPLVFHRVSPPNPLYDTIWWYI